VKLTKCQNHHHHGGVFDTWTEWVKPQAKRAQGPTGRPNSLAGRPGLKSVRPVASWTRVYSRRGRPRQWRKVVEAIPLNRPATWLAWPAANSQVTTSIKSVELPHGPINTPSMEIRTHTPLHGNSTCKTLILSVVARRSLVGRVVRL
jgi:hypothetical protein